MQVPELEEVLVLVSVLEPTCPTHRNLHCLQRLELVVAQAVLLQLVLALVLPSRQWMNCLRKQGLALVQVVLVQLQTELVRQPVLKELEFPTHWSCRARDLERVVRQRVVQTKLCLMRFDRPTDYPVYPKSLVPVLLRLVLQELQHSSFHLCLVLVLELAKVLVRPRRQRLFQQAVLQRIDPIRQ